MGVWGGLALIIHRGIQGTRLKHVRNPYAVFVRAVPLLVYARMSNKVSVAVLNACLSWCKTRRQGLSPAVFGRLVHYTEQWGSTALHLWSQPPVERWRKSYGLIFHLANDGDITARLTTPLNDSSAGDVADDALQVGHCFWFCPFKKDILAFLGLSLSLCIAFLLHVKHLHSDITYVKDSYSLLLYREHCSLIAWRNVQPLLPWLCYITIDFLDH